MTQESLQVASVASASLQSATLSERVSVSPYDAAVVSDAAIASWLLDDAGPTFIDRIAASNGTGSGPLAVRQPGLLADGDTAVLFSQTAPAVISVPPTAALNALDGSSALSQELWFTIGPSDDSAAPGSSMLLVNWQGENHGANSIGAYWTPAQFSASGIGFWTVYTQLAFVIGNNQLFASTVNVAGDAPLVAIRPGTRHHLVSSFDGTTLTLDIDGVAIASESDPGIGPLLLETSGLQIGGADSGAGAIGWIGVLGKVAIYGVALTPAQRAAHYAKGFLKRVPSAGGLTSARFASEALAA